MSALGLASGKKISQEAELEVKKTTKHLPHVHPNRSTATYCTLHTRVPVCAGAGIWCHVRILQTASVATESWIVQAAPPRTRPTCYHVLPGAGAWKRNFVVDVIQVVLRHVVVDVVQVVLLDP